MSGPRSRGGLAAAANMTPEQRSERARKAGRAARAKATPEERSAQARLAAYTRWMRYRIQVARSAK